MTVYKQQVSALLSAKSDLEELMFELQDMEFEEAKEAGKLVEDAFDLIKEAISLLS